MLSVLAAILLAAVVLCALKTCREQTRQEYDLTTSFTSEDPRYMLVERAPENKESLLRDRSLGNMRLPIPVPGSPVTFNNLVRRRGPDYSKASPANRSSATISTTENQNTTMDQSAASISPKSSKMRNSPRTDDYLYSDDTPSFR